MGGHLSVPWGAINQAAQCLWSEGSYIRNLHGNLESLENAIERLKAKRDDVERRVDREEFTGNQRRLAQVQVWLTSVLKVENQFNDLMRSSELESQRLCLGGFCSQDFKESYFYGKKVTVMLREVENLYSQQDFNVMTEAIPIAQVEEMPIQSTIVGQETMLERVWNRLMEDEIGIVGLYGMGGVGKTTLLTQINNKFSEIATKFSIVIWIVVSNGASIYKIQSDIGDKIGLKGEEWKNKNENQRAVDIHKILRNQKFVLLLDDMWEKVTLKTVGVPDPNKNGSKVVFTTRSRDVCGRMEVDDPMEVNCLTLEEAWELFQKKVGVNTLTSHPDILELAKKVAEKCYGLPLALNVIGETMACKTTLQEWCTTIKDLTSSTANFANIENDVFPILKYSYDNLKEEKVKSCFLYCSLFPEDDHIEKEKLIDYWICEGIIDENEGREMALNRGYEILGILLRTCLLMEKHIKTVSMHDVVREMALWITNDFGNKKEQWIVQAGVRLREVPKVKDWKDVRKISLMENDIETIIDRHDRPELTTFFLQNNKRLVLISGELFRSMAKLVVLDLSHNENITELPEEISYLVSLRYIDLSWTNIVFLPVGFQDLKMLIHLNLEDTTRLESLHGISNLTSLRTLRLESSKMMLDMNLMKELELLDHLEYITIYLSPSLFEEQLSYDSRVWRCIQQVDIEDLEKESVIILGLPAAMTNLHRIRIESCGILEIKIVNTSWNKSFSTPCFSNLSTVLLSGCGCLRDLTWLLFAPNLTSLHVRRLKQLEAIISKENVEKEEDATTIVPFRKLQYFHLYNLPHLSSIYWSSLPFPCLTELHVIKCPNLRKFPFDSQSVHKITKFKVHHDNDEEFRKTVEWEDVATSQRFNRFF